MQFLFLVGPVVCSRAHVVLCFLCMFAINFVQHFAVADLFSFLCCFVCVRHVSCVPNGTSFSGLYTSPFVNKCGFEIKGIKGNQHLKVDKIFTFFQFRFVCSLPIEFLGGSS